MSPAVARPVVLTLGDPAGIGGEIALRAWQELRENGPAFVVIGDAAHLSRLGGTLGVPTRIVSEPGGAASVMADGMPVIDHPLPLRPTLGRPDKANAAAVVSAIDRGVAMARAGAALALCTNPISKLALIEGAGFAFPGHTEYLAHLAGAPHAVMMLASPMLRVVPTTVHIPVSETALRLTPALLETTLRITRAALVADFGLPDPRIAVAGLNPHAGEGGKFGREEIEIIIPVLDRLRAEGFRLDGPRSADTLFHRPARASYDAAICMYHDQALIPIKTLDFAGGVNVTLGLDFVRTSPDHGTAHDIAAELRADPSSLIAALRLAAELGARRLAARAVPVA